MSQYDEDKYERISPEDPINGRKYFEQVLSRLDIDLNDPRRQLCVKWPLIIGEDLAKHVYCDRIEDDNLFLCCDSGAYASLMKMDSKNIKSKLNAVFPELGIKKISCFVRPYK